jgi:hypothetical protein
MAKRRDFKRLLKEFPWLWQLHMHWNDRVAGTVTIKTASLEDFNKKCETSIYQYFESDSMQSLESDGPWVGHSLGFLAVRGASQHLKYVGVLHYHALAGRYAITIYRPPQGVSWLEFFKSGGWL